MTKNASTTPTRPRSPRWWQLYIMLPLLVGLYLPEMRLHLSRTEHILAQLGILALIYAYLHIWMRANRRALMGLDEELGEWRVRVYEIPSAQLLAGAHRAPGARRRSQLPESEIKGVLSTTFELDDSEADSALPASPDTAISADLLKSSDSVNR
jgi:hypothetical protein